jgi:hypothetical protein
MFCMLNIVSGVTVSAKRFFAEPQQPGQDSQDRTARTGQPGKNGQGRRAKVGLSRQNS